MLRASDLLAVLLGLALTSGCSPPPPRSVTMTLDAVNTADKILVVEGETDLPSGSRLQAEIQNRDGKPLLRDQAVVRRGAFYFDFDLGRLSEFSAYRARVFFDPAQAPLGVRLNTGLWGEALQGEGVRKMSDRRVYWKETEILLSPSALGKDWEGRDFKEMEGNERARLISDMERYIEERGQDKTAKLALARAYLADEPKEYAKGSRAYLLLKDVATALESNRDGKMARSLLAEIEKVDKGRKKEAELKAGFAKGDRYRRDFTVSPGKNLGGFRIGTPYRVAGRFFKLDRSVDFSDPESSPTVTLLDFHKIELSYDFRSRRLVSVRTTSPKFKLSEGYGVGSLLQELQKAYGTDVVPTPDWEPVGTAADGSKLYRGVVVTDGLEFEIARSVDSVVGIPVDKVSAITVFKRYERRP
jgi:hypothetical protein